MDEDLHDLEDLLEHWRDDPCSLLADVIDTLPAAPGPDLPKATDRVDWAHERIRELDAPSLAAILAVVHEQQRTIRRAVELMDALVERWPTDPRLTTLFAAWLEEPPFVTNAGQKVWVRVFKLLQCSPDARVLTLPGRTNLERMGGRRRWVEGKLGRLAARQIPDQEPTPEQEHRWGGALQAHAAREARREEARLDVAALYEAVYRSPKDLVARRILADALLELDDPRGEFLQLQLGPSSPATRKREKALLGRYEPDWAGTVGTVLQKGGRRWENGFLTAGRLQVRNLGEALGVADDPAWRLMRDLDLGRSPMFQHPAFALLEAAPLVSMERMTSIKSLRGLRAALARSQQLEEIELITARYAYAPADPFPKPRHIPRVRMEGRWVGLGDQLAPWFTTDELVARATLQGLEAEGPAFPSRVAGVVRTLAGLTRTLDMALTYDDHVVVRLQGTTDELVLDLLDVSAPAHLQAALEAMIRGLRGLPLALGQVDPRWHGLTPG